MKLTHNIGRIEALSDGVFAFAATLMAVNLNFSGESELFEKEIFQLISFGVSFFALIMIWKVHYDFFRRTGYMDNLILALNCIFLFLVLYFIFPLKSLVTSIFQQTLMSLTAVTQIFAMYGLGFSFLFLCIALMYLRAYTKSDIPENNFKLLEKSRHFGIFVFVGTVSTLISFSGFGIKYGLPGFVYFLIAPLSYFNAVQFNKNHGTISN